VLLTHADGSTEEIAAESLAAQSDGTYRLNRPASAARGTAEQETIVPILEEFATITKREVKGTTTRIEKHVRERIEHLEEALRHDEVEVRRVPMNRVVERAPDVRIDGDVTIIPVMEERVVKVLLLREEIHVRRHAGTQPFKQDVKLRTDEVQVTRKEPGAKPDRNAKARGGR